MAEPTTRARTYCATIVSVLPELVESAVAAGVTARAHANGLFALDVLNPRHFTRDRHRTVDDVPYGGGAGMVLKADVMAAAINEARAQNPGAPVIALSAQGRPFDQAMARTLAMAPGMVLVCGRYEGFDERALEGVDLELSVGDFVLSGGELPAMLVLDAVLRLLPEVLGNAESIACESHEAGLLEHPHYTRPATLSDGRAVPPVLLSGDHAAIERWRREAALGNSWLRRPELLAEAGLGDEDRAALRRWMDAFRRQRRALCEWYADDDGTSGT